MKCGLHLNVLQAMALQSKRLYYEQNKKDTVTLGYTWRMCPQT